MDFITQLLQQNGLATVGIVSYLIVAFRDLPAVVWKNLKQFVSFSLSVDSKNRRHYQYFNMWLLTLKSKSLNNHIALDKDAQERDDRNRGFSLNLGSYFVFKFPEGKKKIRKPIPV